VKLRLVPILSRLFPRGTRAASAALLLGLAVLLPLAWPATARAHEMPRRLLVRAFLLQEAARLRLLVRVPLEAMRDVDLPLRGQGALDLPRATPALREAAQLWVAGGITVRDGARDLGAPQLVAVRASLPSDGAFAAWETALAHVAAPPLPDSVDIPAPQVMLDVLLEWPLAAPVTELVVDPRWGHLGVETTTVLLYRPPTGGERPFTFTGDPGAVRLDPSWWQAAWRFVPWGMEHLVGGVDHLLFLLCLVAPLRRLRPLVGIVTAFTLAHSVTLAAAALGYAPDALWFPPLVEVLIAASIVYTALENILGARLEARWQLAFGFGLVHGFGFASALGDGLQFAGGHLMTALAAFNVGLELAQVAVVAAAVPVLDRLLGRVVPERAGIAVLSALVAHTAWHWMTERWAVVQAFPIAWPALDALFLQGALRVLMGGLLVLALYWAVAGIMRRLAGAPAVSALPTAPPAATVGSPAGAWWMAVTLAGGTLLAGGAATAAAQGATSTRQGVYTADQAAKGRQVFNGNCLGCHTTATHMGAAFENKWFGRPLFDLYDYVSQMMPKAAPGSLTEDEYVWLVAYILRLNGMPAGRAPLEADPARLKAVRIEAVPTDSRSPAGSMAMGPVRPRPRALRVTGAPLPPSAAVESR
jgi:mono/diheme cytochrome c family protein